MGIGDLFTGQPLKDAAAQNRGILTQTGTNLINSTANAAQGAGNILKDQYGLASGNLGQGYGAAQGAINQGAGSALDYLSQGNQAAQGTLQANGGAYQPLSDLAQRYGQGAGMYANSLGLNGAQGNQQAQDAFQAGPGYQFALDQGINALTRQANTAGGGGSPVGGNVYRDTLKFGQGLANQEYGNWQNKLGAYNNLELGATQGAAAGNQSNNMAIANLQNTGGQNQAQVATGQGNSLADLARQYYGGQAGLDTNYGTAAAGNITGANNTSVGIGMGLAPRIGQTYTDAANAEMQGNKNQWTGLMDVAKLAAGGAGSWGGSLGGGGMFDPSMWNASLPKGSLTGL